MANRRGSGRGAGRGLWLPFMAMSVLALMLGCGGGGGVNGGGGGGGGGTLGPCGSPEGSTTPVICGRVMQDGSTNPVAGVTVILRNDSGAELRRTTTDASGEFKFQNAAGGTQLETVPPDASYYPNTARYQGYIYDFEQPNKAGTGNCYIATGVTSGDRSVGIVFVFPNSTPPPPPMGGCPR